MRIKASFKIKKLKQEVNYFPTKEVEDSYPKGTIYTIYSLNLRYLFQVEKNGSGDDTEKDFSKKIKTIRKKIKIINWIKAKQRQELFKIELKGEQNSDRNSNESDYKTLEEYEKDIREELKGNSSAKKLTNNELLSKFRNKISALKE